MNRYYARNKQKLRGRDHCPGLVRRYGLACVEYNQKLKDQGGVCAICGKPDRRRLSVDHDHDTGAVRGLLCSRCNSGIGFMDDDLTRLRAAVRYLELAAASDEAKGSDKSSEQPGVSGRG